MSAVKAMTLPSGDQMPTLGIGTWTEGKNVPTKTRAAIKAAIDAGYRLLDCAWIYGNEDEVGEAIEDKIKDGTVKREELFVVTKLWCNAHRRGAVAIQLKESLKNLKLDYIDLYLVHFPVSFKERTEAIPKDKNGKTIYEYHDIVDTWKGMEDMVDAGLVRNIGLSNFNIRQVQKILDNARYKPAINQIEVHPYLTRVQMVSYCQERGLIIMAYSPFSSPARSWATSEDPVLLEDPVIKAIAVTKGKTTAQIILRFLLQRGLVVIPKSFTPSRITENFQVFDFELSKNEMDKIFALNKNMFVVEQLANIHFPDHPENPYHGPF